MPGRSNVETPQAGAKGQENGNQTHGYQCADCQTVHCEPARCSKCGACLHKHSKQIPDDMYPLFSCTLCGEVNFWD